MRILGCQNREDNQAFSAAEPLQPVGAGGTLSELG
jgi:hypothetical protein